MDYLYALQSLREAGPALINYCFLFISEIVIPCAVALIAVIYWSINKEQGIIIGMGYVFSYSINQTVKNIACIPRPWLLDSRLHVDALAEAGATGFSFPSGHTVTAASVFCGISVWQKKRKWLVALCYILILLTAFSRNWLGCHTMKDVVIAILIAAVTTISLNLSLLWYGKNQNKTGILCLAGCVISLLVLAFLVFKPYNVEDAYPLITDCYSSCGMICGLLTGWALERKFVNFTTEVSVKRKVLRVLIGLLILVPFYIIGSKIFAFLGAHFAHLVKYFLIFFAITYLYPLVFTAVEKRN